TQTQWVIDQLKMKHPTTEYVIKIIQTKGDQIQNVPLSEVGGTGIFVKEIENALLSGEIDFAVHSFKDIPSSVPEGLTFANCPLREDPRDVLITKHPIDNIAALPKKAKIGTGSKRRQFQLLKLLPECTFVPIRGNVDSRIKKLGEELDGIILAMAGINRLGLMNLEGYHQIPFTIEQMLPSPCQGLLGLELKSARLDLLDHLNQIGDQVATLQGKMERSFLKAAGGSCHIPIGAYCQVSSTQLKIEGLLGRQDGERLTRKAQQCSFESSENIGENLGRQLMEEVGL
ncbi:MAG: hydroxymethylbilane synthase, partial [Vallitaleaceae bacterium]|nr:hydroxymethylbilane synthase [Vallitaleaceae bacterium]